MEDKTKKYFGLILYDLLIDHTVTELTVRLANYILDGDNDRLKFRFLFIISGGDISNPELTDEAARSALKELEGFYDYHSLHPTK